VEEALEGLEAVVVVVVATEASRSKVSRRLVMMLLTLTWFLCQAGTMHSQPGSSIGGRY
jgi:hypothetical protein